MFPIVNAAGKIVGFGGRVMDQGMPKYLNSSETPLFHKGSTLYGLYQAKEGIRQADRVVVVEGYLDVIALAQYGVAYAVATLGTALDRRSCARLVALHQEYHRAVRRRRRRAQGGGAQFRDLCRSRHARPRGVFAQGRRSRYLCSQATARRRWKRSRSERCRWPIIIFPGCEQRYGKTLEGKSQIASEISRLLAKVTNPFEVDLLVRRAVDMLGIREELLRRPAASPGATPAARGEPSGWRRAGAQGNRDDIAERSLVGLMLRLPAVLDDWRESTRCANGLAPNGVRWLTDHHGNGKKRRNIDVRR